MRILKQSNRREPKVSLILLDWHVRDSFHLLYYLKTQTATRNSFEVIVIEYYDYVSKAVEKFESEVDTWVLLQMPDDCYYHKHLMYNTGIVFAQGDILMFGDSDAMVRPTFIERIITSFNADPLLVYQMDEFRNVRRDLYPFNYPSFEEVLGDGCINNIDGKTKGVLDTIDPMHTRNYGACMCALREDIISIGGADEDLTYLGHICGPYDMTFRLMNFGRRLRWDTEEYLYHTWHPGTDGTDNYLGPHDGKNMSTTALQALSSGRILPLVENASISELRRANPPRKIGSSSLAEILIDPRYKETFSRSKLGGVAKKGTASPPTDTPYASYKGFNVYRLADRFYGVPENVGLIDLSTTDCQSDDRIITGQSFLEICEELDSSEARLIESVSSINICAVGSRYAVVPQSVGPIDFRIRRHRGDPRITWANSLEEARSKAALSKDGLSVHARGAQNRSAALKYPASPESYPEWVTVVAQEMARFDQRLAQLEADVVNIYRSRIWRTLVWIGGLLDALLRRQKSR